MSASVARIVALLLAVAAAVAVPAAGKPAASQAGPVAFSDLRVCPYEAFSKALRACVRDKRAIVLTSNRFACSIHVVARQGAEIQARLTWHEEVVHEYSHPLAVGASDWWIGVELTMDQPLPSGSWHCEFSAGTVRASADFRSGGPSGSIIDLVVCPATMAYRDRDLLICPSDVSETIRADEEIVCNAVCVGHKGELAALDLATAGGQKPRDRWFALLFPIEIVYARVQRQPAGDYACVYKLNGGESREKPFRVVPVPSTPDRGPT